MWPLADWYLCITILLWPFFLTTHVIGLRKLEAFFGFLITVMAISFGYEVGFHRISNVINLFAFKSCLITFESALSCFSTYWWSQTKGSSWRGCFCPTALTVDLYSWNRRWELWVLSSCPTTSTCTQHWSRFEMFLLQYLSPKSQH